MASVFTAMPWQSRSRSGNSRADVKSQAQQEPTDESPGGEPDLRDLNAALQALTDIFPDVQPEVFREMLQTFSGESRLEIVTETVMKEGAKWIHGRYRMPQEHPEQRETARKYKYREFGQSKDTRGIPLALEDTFRSQTYREAVKEAFYHEFKGLSHSTIKAVLAEYNYSYTNARPTLLDLVGKSWRYSITKLFTRLKAPSAENHPLIIWTGVNAKTGRQSVPLLVKTKSKELNEELYRTIILAIFEKRRLEQIREDGQLAHTLYEAEAEETGELYDCECCFTPNTLDQLSTCDIEGHYICFRCINQSANAALYGQGWARNIDSDRCTFRCIAPVSDGSKECSGCIPVTFVERAILADPNGEDTYRKLNERFSSEAILQSQLPLIRCPFCSYAEVDILSLPKENPLQGLKFKPWFLVTASVPLCLCFVLIQCAARLLSGAIIFLFTIQYFLPIPLPSFTSVDAANRRIQLKRRGLKFHCLAPACSRASCLSCSAPWHDPHSCYSSQRKSLRLTLERVTTEAVKRTCPRCNLGFVKSEGCNKLVCPCGYRMCYVCRENLGNEGYSHFCQHFRERPGQPCSICEKCDLYRVEDEDKVIKRAREQAEKEWLEQQGTSAEVLKGSLGTKVKAWEVWLEMVLDLVLA